MYKCKICNFETDKTGKIAAHYSNKHPKVKKEYICSKCGKSNFSRAVDLTIHEKNCDGSGCKLDKKKKRAAERKNFICPDCKQHVVSQNIERHVKACNGGGFKWQRQPKKNLGHIWNKGLTKETSESVRRAGETYSRHVKEGLIIP